ncbi:forkhead-associated domain protein [Rhynchospora pubera]|uniref:Forkhead-associated domain protein n=1 Tax=Rhynchospora pubera TaxID=906938 RepID=A0AAV8C467_9POAL|nr:forkhead-associated domain protein [Rhynchospora pubera]
MLLRGIVAAPPHGLAVFVRRKAVLRPGAVSNRQETQQLRHQLDQLHLEADLTRTKSQHARQRLMRLTEKIENLKRRAAYSVLAGKEVEAVELLVQKKQLVQALERLKYRIEVLDKLTTKINEAISMKQNKLIDNVAAEADIYEDKQEFGKDQISIPISGSTNKIDDLKGLQSYKEFLINIDKRLALLENDLEKVSTPEFLTGKTKQRLSDVLKDLLGIREMIASFIISLEDDN